MTSLLHIASASLLVLATTHARAEDESRKITVTGTAVVRSVPDVIVWKISTTDQDPELNTAKKSSDAKLRAILGLREELAIAPEDVQTGHLRIRKVYERDRQNNQQEFKYFEVTREVTIKQRDLKRFDEYLTKLTSAAEMDLEFSFESTRYHELRRMTQVEAVRVAREKAKTMVEELGAKLGEVLTIEEPEPTYQSWASNRAFTNPSSPEDSSSGTFAPGAIEIQVSVRVAFAIV